MRVIAGRFKGARLFTPKGNWMRPTADRVREYVFSCIGDGIRRSRVLDLYAGTGSFGIEALSRGAMQVTFVDISPKAMAILKSNLEKLGAEAETYQMSAASFLKRSAKTNNAFDYIFCDPPYDSEQLHLVMPMIRESDLLCMDGTIIWESSSRIENPLVPGFNIDRTKKLGDTKITFYRRTDGREEKDRDLSGLF